MSTNLIISIGLAGAGAIMFLLSYTDIAPQNTLRAVSIACALAGFLFLTMRGKGDDSDPHDELPTDEDLRDFDAGDDKK